MLRMHTKDGRLNQEASRFITVYKLSAGYLFPRCHRCAEFHPDDLSFYLLISNGQRGRRIFHRDSDDIRVLMATAMHAFSA